ncbi:MAG: peptidoglycan-associated lipoprotein Pal [Mariprofundaceae bacterium]
MQYFKLTIMALAAAGLLFSGCAKKEVEDTSSKMIDSTPVVKQVVKAHKAAPGSNSVYFAFDSSALDEASESLLNHWAVWMGDHPDMSVTIEGNCDERGSREYNLALGQRRSDSVKDYLVSKGASASSIDTVSFGEEQPACTGSGEACWAQNRRADIVTRK